jgi:hypothetical protein
MRRFHGATPFAGTRTTDPDMAEYEALQEAWRIARADRRRPYQHGYVPVRGSRKVAHVAIRGDEVTSHIRGDAINMSMNFIKSWDGVPGLFDGQPATVMFPNPPARQDMRRFPGGRVDVHAPPAQTVYIPEEIVVVRQRIIREVHLDDKHVQENASADLQIQMDPSQVRVHENQQVIETRIEAKPRGFWERMLIAPDRVKRAPQQQAPQLAPPQAVDKGELRAVPNHTSGALPPRPQAAPMSGAMALPSPQRQPAPQANAPLQLSHQPQMPIPQQRKKSWSFL